MNARALLKIAASSALLLAIACDVKFIAGPDVVRNGESVLYQILVEPEYGAAASNATIHLTGDVPAGWSLDAAKFQVSVAGGGGDLTVHSTDPGVITGLPAVPAGHRRIYLSAGPFPALTDGDRGTALLGFTASGPAGGYTMTFWAGVSSSSGSGQGVPRSLALSVMAPEPANTILADGFEFGTTAGWSGHGGVDAAAVAFLPLDGNTDDASAYGNHGYPMGGPTPAPDRFGTAGAALQFDGVDDQVLIPDAPSLDVSEAITLAAWARPAATGNPYIVGKNNLYGGGFLYSLDFLTSTASGRLRDDQGAGVRATGYIPLEPDVWQLLVFTFDGSELLCFVDGVLEGHLEHPGAIGTGDGEVEIGSYLEARYRGVLDDVLIMNRALTYREVLQMMP